MSGGKKVLLCPLLGLSLISRLFVISASPSLPEGWREAQKTGPSAMRWEALDGGGPQPLGVRPRLLPKTPGPTASPASTASTAQ